MKTILLLLVGVCSCAFAEPERVRLVDGSVLEGVRALVILPDGSIKLTHSGGITKHKAVELVKESRDELGIAMQEKRVMDGAADREILEEAGKFYKGVRSARLSPCSISVTHEGGVSKLSWEQMPAEIREKYAYDAEAGRAYQKEMDVKAAMQRREIDKVIAKAKADAKEKWLMENRSRTLAELEFTSYGSLDYWGSGINGRKLQDLMVAKALAEAGFSPEEARMYMNRLRFR